MFEERLFGIRCKHLIDLLNDECEGARSMLGVRYEYELVKAEDREKVVSLLNKFVTSVKQIQETLLLKPPMSSEANAGGIRTITSHLNKQLKDRCGDEIDGINQLLKKLTVRPSLYLEPEGRGLEVRMEEVANREFTDTVAGALMAAVRLIERKEMDRLRRCDCGKWYFASRSDQKSCSATCRQRRHAGTPEFRAARRAYRETAKSMDMKKTRKKQKRH